MGESLSLGREERAPVPIRDVNSLLFTQKVKDDENDLLAAAIPLLETREDFLSGSKAAPSQLLCRIRLNSAKKHSGLVFLFFGTYIHFEAMLIAWSLFCVLVPVG